MPKKPLLQILIARHAAQAMLRHALDSQPSTCCGLLAGNEDHIQSATAVADATQMMAEWQRQPSQWMGVYRSGSKPEDIFNELGSTTPDVGGLLYLAVDLDTDGRLDTHAWQLHESDWSEVPLVLEEDAATA